MSVVSGPRVEKAVWPQASSCLSILALILCIGTWPGPSIMTWTSWRQAIWVSSPRVASSANWASASGAAGWAGAVRRVGRRGGGGGGAAGGGAGVGGGAGGAGAREMGLGILDSV